MTNKACKPRHQPKSRVKIQCFALVLGEVNLPTYGEAHHPKLSSGMISRIRRLSNSRISPANRGEVGGGFVLGRDREVGVLVSPLVVSPMMRHASYPFARDLRLSS